MRLLTLGSDPERAGLGSRGRGAHGAGRGGTNEGGERVGGQEEAREASSGLLSDPAPGRGAGSPQEGCESARPRGQRVPSRLLQPGHSRGNGRPLADSRPGGYQQLSSRTPPPRALRGSALPTPTSPRSVQTHPCPSLHARVGPHSRPLRNPGPPPQRLTGIRRPPAALHTPRGQ